MAEEELRNLWSWLTGAPLRAAIIVAVGVLVVMVTRMVLSRAIARLAAAPVASVSESGKVTVSLGGVPGDHTRARRLRTLQQLLSSTLTAVAVVVVVIMVLAEFNVDVTPLIASASIVGVAVAFGAQSLVTDVVTGLFMLAENQYNVGDRVELGAVGNILAAGTVEEVGLRVTTVRDDEGKIWYVRNGQVLRVSNESQGWSLAVVDIALAPENDVSAVREQVERYLIAALAEPELATAAVPGHDPVVRVSDISATSAVLQVRVQAEAGMSQPLASMLRRRLYAEFTRTGITLV